MSKWKLYNNSYLQLGRNLLFTKLFTVHNNYLTLMKLLIYSDLDELFGENCKFRFVVMNQYVISKKRKAKKKIICKLYFLLFYIKHNYCYF